jgi:hypothetical protein
LKKELKPKSKSIHYQETLQKLDLETDVFYQEDQEASIVNSIFPELQLEI